MMMRRSLGFLFGGRATGLQRIVSGGLLSSVFAVVALPLALGQRSLASGPHWDPAMAPLAAFVEKTRDQQFREPVPIVFVSDAGFAAQRTTLRTPTVRSFATELAFRSAGFPAPPTLVGASQLRDFALYDASKKRVVVRGDRLEPSLAPDVVEALTDALHHQVFDLSETLEPGSEASRAWQSVLVGDAKRVSRIYRYSHGIAPDRRSSAGEAVAISAYELLVEADRQFPATWGEAMVTQTFRDGGNAGVDVLFRRPPRDTADVLRRAFGDANGGPIFVSAAGNASFGATGWFGVVSRFAPFDEALAAARSLVAESTTATATTGAATPPATSATATRASVLAAEPCFDAMLEVLASGPWRSLTPRWTDEATHAVGTISTCQNGAFDFASSDAVDALRAYTALPRAALALASRRNRSVAWALCVGVEVVRTTGPASVFGDVEIEPAQTATGRATCDDPALVGGTPGSIAPYVA